MWKLVQLAIVLLIVWSNLVCGWTQNDYMPVLIGVLLARVITGVGWRLWHWRHGLPVPATEPFHKNLIAHKTIAEYPGRTPIFSTVRETGGPGGITVLGRQANAKHIA
jgi:hypothetical protein